MVYGEVRMIYLGEWANASVYQPEYDPETWDAVGLPSRVYKCSCCKVRWFRSITNFYDGMCYYCWKEQYDGMDDIPLERSE